MRQEKKKRERNKALKSYMKNLRKKTLAIMETENAKQEEIIAALNFYKSQIDKAWAKGIFKKNKSSRLKSRIDHYVAHKFQTDKM